MLSSRARARLFAPHDEARDVDDALAAMRSFRRALRRCFLATPPARPQRRGTPGGCCGAGDGVLLGWRQQNRRQRASLRPPARARVRVRARSLPDAARSRSRSLDLLVARRLLQSWDAGLGGPRVVSFAGGGRHPGAYASFARGQLRLQAFDAPPSWAAAAAAAGNDGCRDQSEPPCAVCLEPVLTGRVVAGPACLHRLHEACALQLASATSASAAVACPTCRAPLLAMHCRAPGEAGDCAAGEEETEDEDDGEENGSARGITAQARPTAPTVLRALYSERRGCVLTPAAARHRGMQDLELLQLLLQQAARSAGRQHSWFGPPVLLAPDVSDDDVYFDDSDDEEQQQRRRAAGRSSLMRRIFCRRRDAAAAAPPPDNAATPQHAAEADAATSVASHAEAGAAAREHQPQCGCVVM